VEILVTEGPRRVRGLAELGARFDLAADGGLALTREGGHGADRIVHAGGDATGWEVSRALVAALEALPETSGVTAHQHAVVVDVLTDGAGAACGVLVHDEGRGGLGEIAAGAVVLATGGIGQVFRSTTNPPEATGDGAALALRAGADLADLEFVQFHPTVLWLGGAARGQQPLISEAVRGEGAVLVDEQGRRFMLDVDPRGELAPRDVVARGIVERMRETGADCVHLDARHLGRRFLRRRFPTIDARLREAGFDMSRDLVPVSPAAHYHSGGVRTDLSGRTTVDRLYAVGECACTGVHGANRLASNSLLEGLVFAARLGDDVAARARDGRPGPGSAVQRPGPAGLVPASARTAVQRAASRGPGAVRDAESLASAARSLARIRVGVPAGPTAGAPAGLPEWESTNLWQVATALTDVAARREETRGGHLRTDHPATDPAWRRRQRLRLDVDGRLVVDDEAVPDRAVERSVVSS
jgi:L-aspartate oxidase